MIPRITFGLQYWLTAAAFLGLAMLSQCSPTAKNSVAYQIAQGVGPSTVAVYCQTRRPECLDVEQRYGPALRGEGIYGATVQP